MTSHMVASLKRAHYIYCHFIFVVPIKLIAFIRKGLWLHHNSLSFFFRCWVFRFVLFGSGLCVCVFCVLSVLWFLRYIYATNCLQIKLELTCNQRLYLRAPYTHNMLQPILLFHSSLRCPLAKFLPVLCFEIVN